MTRDNPFLVLALSAAASGPEAERAGQRWLAMLEAGLASAARYETPWGPGVRTAESVRWALAELRDPERRARHAFWLRTPAAPCPIVDVPRPGLPSVPGLRRRLGLGRRP